MSRHSFKPDASWNYHSRAMEQHHRLPRKEVEVSGLGPILSETEIKNAVLYGANEADLRRRNTEYRNALVDAMRGEK